MAEYKINVKYNQSRFKNTAVEGEEMGKLFITMLARTLNSYGFKQDEPGSFINNTDKAKDKTVIFSGQIWSADMMGIHSVVLRSTTPRQLEINFEGNAVPTNSNDEIIEDIRKELEDNFIIEPGAQFSKEEQKSGGCYIATAVYGSYDCPEVWTLRRYRDEKLFQSTFGRMFVKAYYATSPTVVKLFGRTEWFNKFWRGRLNKMVDNLKAEGYEDTPYYDR